MINRWTKTVWLIAGSLVLGFAAVTAAQDTVVGSPHDLSVSGPGTTRALFEEQVCIFCHAPHNATGQSPLWNRLSTTTHYRIYESSTTDARIDQPSGPSKMCLSCHDGSIAVGLVASRPPTDPFEMTRRTIPPGRTDLTENLSDDHPIGFRFDKALFNRDGQLKNPDLITPDLPMGLHNEVQCTTCHDPHNNRLGDFLRITDVRSAICLSCHDMLGWQTGSHALSPAPARGRSVDPREPMPHPTVADNACTSCHKVHSADSPSRLLRFANQQDNCTNCHNGGVARTNILDELRKPSGHGVLMARGRHDPNEDPRVMGRHVDCVDCHNPHAARASLPEPARSSTPALLDPTTRFVSGVSRTGRVLEEARFEYELCFKCHADGITRPRQGDISRQITQTNTRLEFQTSNPSFHPVIGPRQSSDVVSLIPPLRAGSVIGCTDCHNSDSVSSGGMGGASGPHGSIYEPLLIDNYATADFTAESPRAYSLCYRCHDRQSILGDESFPLHNAHVVRGRTACATCHDAHGISRTQGGSTTNSNLINFDLSVVQPASGGLGGRIEYVDTGRFSGSCTLTCHGVTHVQFQYGR